MTAKMPGPLVMEGRTVRLVPLGLEHVPDLFVSGGGDDEVWRWMPVATPRTEERLRQVALSLLENPGVVPFAVVLRETGRAIGWTTYHDVPGFDHSLEIGWTWYGRAHWRTAVNTECKLMLLAHAFEVLGHNRVLLKTDCLNTRSQDAIRRIGGVYEGTLRRHRPRPDGTWRDTVYFGILDDEWPPARRRLEEILGL
ncbi:N-acetyltransferase [Sphaerisporangium album]|uniref:N-acetyltransferase n=1 Tax=Sphaerisporangium album TaxID=509200 RepID=A0A367FC50_9ACTN|nr:GNAT family protein [Sphaerisporangium album]RCG27265.1 N-acetyltransferase [Sphaerisporangium album]